MYAKKPREPGAELAKPVRRRSKKKELLKNQFLVQEMMYDPPPKINIIRYAEFSVPQMCAWFVRLSVIAGFERSRLNFYGFQF